MSSYTWRDEEGKQTIPHFHATYYICGGALLLALSLLVGWAFWSHPQVHGDVPASAEEQKIPHGVPSKGQPAPNFTLPALNSDSQTLEDWRGHPVLINFWASWCGPCRREMPELIDGYKKYQEAGLVILAVNLTHLDSRANAEAFAEEFQIPFPVLFDDSGDVADFLYGARALPMSFFIDPAGNIKHIYVGAANSTWIDQVIAEIKTD